MECARCGAALPSGQEKCTACGAPAARPESTISDDEIHRLLAEANLLRIRKQLDDATGVCARVLRLDPSNATAHSLMGDIHRDEGNHREALGWYKLAVQLNPSNQADRKKLDETIDHVFKGVVQGGGVDATSIDAEFAEVPSGKTGTNGLKAILDRLTPTHVAITTTALAIVVIAIILFSPLAGSKAQEQKQPAQQRRASGHETTTQPGSNATDPTATQGQPPQVTPPAPDGVEGVKIGGLPVQIVPTDTNKEQTPKKTSAPPANNGSETSTTAVQVPPFEPQSRNRMSAEELEKQTQQLKEQLEATLKESKLPATLDSVTIDPRSNVVALDFTIPPMAGATETKQGLIYTGFKLVWAADKSTHVIKAFALRGYAYHTNGKDLSLALLADISPQQADEARQAEDYKAVVKYLANTWWRNDLEGASL